MRYPVLIDTTGRCPPEDVGGPWGYDEFLHALADPALENHAEMKDWIGKIFDPTAVNVEAIADDVAALAKAWARKPPARKDCAPGRGVGAVGKSPAEATVESLA